MQRPTTDAPVRRRSRKSRIFLLTLLAIGVAILFRQGLVPSWLEPAAGARPRQRQSLGWSTGGWRRSSTIPTCAGACWWRPHIEAQPIADSPLQGRLRLAQRRAHVERRAACAPATTRSPARPPPRSPSGSSTTCSRWRRRSSASASPSSRASAPTRAATSSAMRKWKSWRSEHATANAVDIGGFQLADGRRISVRAALEGDGAEAPLPARRARPRLPLLPRGDRPRPQRRPPRPFPPRPRPPLRCN